MRRWIVAAGTAGVVLIVMAGCSLPEGVDGALTDDWPQPAAPQMWSPKAGDCHITNASEVVSLAEYRPVSCDVEHTVETAHVGTFSGEHANRDATPPAGSSAARAAFGECVTKTTEYLGDDFRTGRVWLQVTLPSDVAWSGGARWFRCDVWEYARDDRWVERSVRKGSLRDSLKGERPLGFGCYMITKKNDKIDKVEPVGCGEPHNAEFAGMAIAKDMPYPKGEKELWEVQGKQCVPLIASYAGLNDDPTLSRRVNLIYQGLGEPQWERGNRGVRCFLYLDKNVTKVMKGAGPSAFPVR